MSEFDDILENEEALKQTVRETITGICERGDKFPNVCSLASRSAQDEHDVVEQVFVLMTKERLGLEQALASVNSNLSE